MDEHPNNPSERRDTGSRDRLMRRFRQELQRVPGIALTVEQASGLCDVSRDICGRLLASLNYEGAIYVRPDGCFVGFATG